MQPIIKKSRVRVVEGPPRPLAPPQASPAAPADDDPEEPPRALPKEARLVRIDGEVRAIELRCSCGETTLLELEYEGPPAPPMEDEP